MYQTIVVGLGFLLLFGGSYLIKETDNNGVLHDAAAETAIIQSVSDVSGTYICDVDSRCLNPRELTLSDTGEASLTTSFDSGIETLKETGMWKLGQGNSIVLSLAENSQEAYSEPFVISLKRITEKTLMTSGETHVSYKDWGNPIFRKQENQSE
jgi:hypothetical protein